MPNTFVNDFLGKYMKATIRLENKKMKIKEQVNNNSFRYCTLLETLLETLSIF
jgi:predicted DNA binding CopG/RHH family protein